jgi:hypothetical protein
VSYRREGFDTQLRTGRVISSSLTSTSVVIVIVSTSPLASPILLRFELLLELDS